MSIDFELTYTDRHFADLLLRHSVRATPWLEQAASLASNAVTNGNICLNLASLADSEIIIDGRTERVPPWSNLRENLIISGVVGLPGEFKPLVLDTLGRIYLYRYWKYEQDLARVLSEKVSARGGVPDENLLKDSLQRLFPVSGDGIDWQKIAALLTLYKRFCVISGGPGTGKTTTVVKILAILLEQPWDTALRVAMAAPTGKAATRLKESIQLMKSCLNCSDELKGLIPEDVTTLHRLLGVRSGTHRFRHGEENLLPYDVVIIDEASMVALPLMAKLVCALGRETRLILLGDRDQLASVEAGAALGDICGRGGQEYFSEDFSTFVNRVSGDILSHYPAEQLNISMADTLVVLRKNYRFGNGSGIGGVAKAVNKGCGSTALSLLSAADYKDCSWLDLSGPEMFEKTLADFVVSGYRAYLSACSPADALRLFDDFRILCAVRKGIYGVVNINLLVERILADKGLIEKHNRWYTGRPIMITVNDYRLKLFNGDIGIVFPDPESEGNPRVWFSSPSGGVRSVSPSRLPEHETVYAMTVHKSQGSEFSQLLLVLPDRGQAVMTRELIYTGITRAKKHAAVWGDREAFFAAIARRVERASGLSEALFSEYQCSASHKNLIT